MIKFAFIILHYQAYQETVECVESIKALDRSAEAGIIIIDNASPNGSGQLLLDKYGNNNDIRVILNNENSGFSHANNLAIEVARKLWNPEFYIVSNNDIEFTMTDILDKIEGIYGHSSFYILGPDIYAPYKGVHQSPLRLEPPSLSSINKTIVLNNLCLHLFPVCYPLLRMWYKKMKQPGDSPWYRDHLENVQVGGSCVVFSRKYVEERYGAEEKVFWPETRFYSEEAIFTLWSRRHTAMIVYEPSIQVIHKEGAATASNPDERNRIRFQMENILAASKVYREYLLSDYLE